MRELSWYCWRAKLGGLLSVKPAPAAVFITFRIYLNGQLILVTGTYDNGYTSNDGLWNNLKKLLLAAPRALDFAELMPSAERIKFLREDSGAAHGRPSAST